MLAMDGWIKAVKICMTPLSLSFTIAGIWRLSEVLIWRIIAGMTSYIVVLMKTASSESFDGDSRVLSHLQRRLVIHVRPNVPTLVD